MPIVKKAPGIMTREVKLEEPVNELLAQVIVAFETSESLKPTRCES
jgi:hypothetical protein